MKANSRKINDASKNSIVFDRYADCYEETRRVSTSLLSLLMFHLKEQGMLGSQMTTTILDVGCGTGRISRALVQVGYRVIGIDLSMKMLDVSVNKNAGKNYWKFHPLLADAIKLPILSDSIDFCYTIHVLHLIKKWQTVVDEALRCSKKKHYMNGGVFRDYYSLPIWKEYWKYLITEHQVKPSPAIGISKNEDVVTYLTNKGFKYQRIKDQITVNIKRRQIIDYLARMSYSSQRNVPRDAHQDAMKFLEKNDYFLPKNAPILKIKEKIDVWIFTPEEEKSKIK